MKFHVYTLKADTLCLGERIKGGLHRPCSRTLRYSTITPTLRYTLGRDDIHAVGMIAHAERESRYLPYSPQDRAQSVAKVPLSIEYLTNVRGTVYLLADDDALPATLDLMLGAFRSKGFGRTEMQYTGMHEFADSQGKLGVRVPEHLADVFGMQIIRPVYGYLWEPDMTDLTRGRYVRSLFEDTLCIAPACLLKEELLWTLREKHQ